MPKPRTKWVFCAGWAPWALVAALCCGVQGRRSHAADVNDHQPDNAINLTAVQSSALAKPTGHATKARFQRLEPSQTGIDFRATYKIETDDQARLLPTAFAGRGVCVGDYDGDGLADIYLTNQTIGNRLYRNLGNWRFQDVTDQTGVGGQGRWSTGATFADVDGDNDLDLYVCAYRGSNLLYINQGDGKFQEKAEAHGLDYDGASIMMAFSDYDRDGDLDAYLLTNYNHKSEAVARFKRLYAQRRLPPPLVKNARGQLVANPQLRGMLRVYLLPGNKFKAVPAAEADRLYRNNGDGTFTDVSATVGIDDDCHGLSATWWDYNRDGWPDLYVTNDYFDPDKLYRNDGDGTFTDVIKDVIPHTPWFSMGADLADINNDGLIDFMTADMSGTTHLKQKLSMGDMSSSGWFLTSAEPRQNMRNAMYLNTATDRFMEVASMAGLANTDWTWAVKLSDLDNDGRVDVFVTNGMTRDFFDSDLRGRSLTGLQLTLTRFRQVWQNSPPRRDRNLVFQNHGDLHFENMSRAWGLDDETISFGAAMVDLDRDGDLDIVVNNFEEHAGVYRNDVADGHGVLIRLVGTTSNRFGIGATVKINTPAGVQVRYLTLSRGYMSANEPLVHFGLSDDKEITRLTVHWPGGHKQVFSQLPVDQFYTITEPDTSAPEPQIAQSQPAMFGRSNLLVAMHRETEYDDYKRQPLLPQKLSQLGPGMAFADVNGDGREDLYISGPAGHSGQLYLKSADGSFAANYQWRQDMILDAASEDLAPLFFDADSDGDFDLYVASGGVEHDPGSPLLRDRLYINNGTGSFKKAPDGTLPDVRDSSSVVAACDFDRDGDLDLFVGGRVIPGKYPLTPNSRLLRNDHGQFTDITDDAAPGLRTTGLVTSAVWSDADNDGWSDLLVTHEWGPVKLYRNNRGQLADRTDAAGLAQRSGWWNGIAAGDIDNDGDIDYVVTNFGLNTKYHATTEIPSLLYYGDFDGSGTKRLVEAKYEGNTLYPGRGKSCSTNAMPFLNQSFPTFRQFATASLQDIYTPKCLDEAERFEANTFESGILINSGKAEFTFRPLPRLAQASPGFGVVMTDVDADGFVDIYMVQNFFSPQPETGRMDGGLSLLLKGNGDGSFTPVWPKQSGLIVAGDAKALAVTDLNDDNWLDFVVGVNDDQVKAFENNRTTGRQPLKVQLQGKPGNPTAVGARVTIHLDDGSKQTAQVQAGGGYLAQSTSALYFSPGPNRQIKNIQTRWPNGKSTITPVTADQQSIAITYPSP